MNVEFDASLTRKHAARLCTLANLLGCIGLLVGLPLGVLLAEAVSLPPYFGGGLGAVFGGTLGEGLASMWRLIAQTALRQLNTEESSGSGSRT